MAWPRRDDLDAKADEMVRAYAEQRRSLRSIAQEHGAGVGAVRARIIGQSVSIRGRGGPRGSLDRSADVDVSE